MTRLVRTVTLLGLAAVALTTASCVECKYPLSDPADSVQDREMYGCWVSGNEILLVGKSTMGDMAEDPLETDKGLKKYRGQMGLQQISYDIKTSVLPTKLGGLGGSSKSDDSVFWTTSIGGKNYATFAQSKHAFRVYDPDWGKNEDETTLIVRYEVVKNKLRIWDMDQELVAKAVDAGKLKGRVERTKDNEKRVTDVKLTEKGDGIRAFIKGGGELFNKEPREYTRAKIVLEK